MANEVADRLPATSSTRLRRTALQVGKPVAFVGIGTLVLAAVLLGLGYPVAHALGAAIQQVLGDSNRIAATLAFATPLAVASAGTAIAFRAGMYNLGGEGQIIAGAMAAAVAGLVLPAPLASPGIHVLLVLAAGVAAGAAIAAGLGLLRARLGVDELLSTLLSNYILLLLTAYIATEPLRDPERWTGTTSNIASTARLPTLLPGTDLTAALLVAAFVIVGLWWVVERSRLGYDLRMAGQAPRFAQAVGIQASGRQVLAMAISGGVCGLAGAILVAATQHRFWTGIGLGIGWNAVLMTLLARFRPLPASLWGVLFASLIVGSRGMEQAVGVPAEITRVLVSIAILVISARIGLALVGERISAHLQHRHAPQDITTVDPTDLAPSSETNTSPATSERSGRTEPWS